MENTIALAIKLRKEIRGEWLLVLVGLPSILFAVLLLWNPLPGALDSFPPHSSIPAFKVLFPRRIMCDLLWRGYRAHPLDQEKITREITTEFNHRGIRS